MTTTEPNSLESMLDDTEAPAQEIAPAAPPETGDNSAVPPTDATHQAESVDTAPHVPRRALEDERRKRQDLERRFQELEHYAKQFQQPPPQPQKPQIPDPFVDPEAYQQYVEERAQTSVLNERLNMSQMMAEEKYGEDRVKEALEMAAQAGVIPSFMRARHPYKELIEWHDKARVMQDIGPDPAAYRERLKAELMAEMGITQPGQPPAAPPAKTSAPVPKSLATRTSSAPRNPSTGQFASRSSLEDILG